MSRTQNMLFAAVRLPFVRCAAPGSAFSLQDADRRTADGRSGRSIGHIAAVCAAGKPS
ncbi:hypothetical protein PV433_03500 [Paenibacillus sp. GYB004]|uniref:hypothetical protein n=1 Tax=Paenibacillus sp. GYB004 TaxID=2994393 RepID=UPI002F963BAF